MTKVIVKSFWDILIAVGALTSCSLDEPTDSKMTGEEFVSRFETVLNGFQGERHGMRAHGIFGV